jgi:hypothetical protein
MIDRYDKKATKTTWQRGELPPQRYVKNTLNPEKATTKTKNETS